MIAAGQHMLNDPTQPMQLDQDPLSSVGENKRGQKRELSTSKRAAQNRAAQRAFRQRKEGHIKKLEEQVRDYQSLAESYKAVQAENYQLRDYIINLQSRLIASEGDFPPAPGNIDLASRPPVLDEVTNSSTADSRAEGDVEDEMASTAGAISEETDEVAAAESALDLVQEANNAIEAANATANLTTSTTDTTTNNASTDPAVVGQNGIVDPGLNRT